MLIEIHKSLYFEKEKSMPLAHAILGFLEYSPMSGYDLKKLIDTSIGHFWSATQSHIYKALDTLETEGYVEARVIQQEGKPNRKEFHLTDAGRQEQRRWLATPLPLSPVREGWLIQIFFSHAISNEEIAAIVETRMHAVQSVLKVLRGETQAEIDANAAQVGLERATRLWQITLDYGTAYYEAELTWLEKTLEQVRNLPPLVPPRQTDQG
jgi:PadR family transcriptional regulator, regulatory protein AphA